MASILDVIASETHGSSFKTYKYGFDGIEVPRFDYDDHQDGLPGLPILARSWNCCTLKLGTLWGIVLYILILPLLLLFVNSFS